MNQEFVARLADDVVIGIEVAGMAVIVVGIVVTVIFASRRLVGGSDLRDTYDFVRHGVGRSLILGLDLLIASEIVRSINTETLESVAVLGLTILIRTFLSLTLEVEMDGTWPWDRAVESNGSEDE